MNIIRSLNVIADQLIHSSLSQQEWNLLTSGVGRGLSAQGNSKYYAPSFLATELFYILVLYSSLCKDFMEPIKN